MDEVALAMVLLAIKKKYLHHLHYTVFCSRRYDYILATLSVSDLY